MTDSEQPDGRPLTRRQLRELRNTAATPVITMDPEQNAPPAPLPKAAEPAPVASPPVADDSVDLDAPATTRRQARQQERLRTASVPVLDPHHIEPVGDRVAITEEELSVADATLTDHVVPTVSQEDLSVSGGVDVLVEADGTADDAVAESESALPAEDATDDDLAESEEAEPEEAEPEEAEDDGPEAVESSEGEVRGAVLAGSAAHVPPLFDRTLSEEGSSGSSHTENALILSQTPEAGLLTGPVTASGDVIVTGSLAFPDTYGATGAVAGAADGKEMDAVLVDGEIPAASSPTPIAASSAISTIKSAEDIIRPPVPEKGGRVMMVLAITAGVLALALASVLILAFVSGTL
ncbi:hypothetical protein [Microbacterium sp.]|uniref:hypothetical protein n=1 Tax=Microbacterium sp. TaxID=51671 RepID=UPI003A84368C